VIGTEDVLDGGQPPVVGPRPEPEPLDPADRTRFRTRVDVVIAALIAVVVLVVGFVVWLTSEVRATSKQINPNPVATPEQPTVFPPSLGEAWRTTSSVTPVPVAVGPVVVTGNGGEVQGHDALTGDVLWRYQRNLPLCTLSSAWQLAVAVYRTDGNLLPGKDSRSGGGCSEVAELDPASGRYGQQLAPSEQNRHPNLGQRHTDAELGTQLLFDNVYVTATGHRLLLTWRSDLVQTMEYGTLPDLVNPGKQPRTGCDYGSVAVSPGKIGVIERCPSDTGDRLTVYRATNDNKSDEPAVVFSVVVGSGARVVALSETRTAIALSGPSRLAVFDDTGKQVNEYPLDVPEEELRGDPAGMVVPTVKGGAAVYWFTGSRTIALHGVELNPMWSQQGTLGPGVVFAGRELLPVPDGIRVVDQVSGQPVGTFAIDRGGYTGPVMMASVGPMVIEQRGVTLVALR
jgi:hypothetical protein